jgi:hypothetical protein
MRAVAGPPSVSYLATEAFLQIPTMSPADSENAPEPGRRRDCGISTIMDQISASSDAAEPIRLWFALAKKCSRHQCSAGRFVTGSKSG